MLCIFANVGAADKENLNVMQDLPNTLSRFQWCMYKGPSTEYVRVFIAETLLCVKPSHTRAGAGF